MLFWFSMDRLTPPTPQASLRTGAAVAAVIITGGGLIALARGCETSGAPDARPPATADVPGRTNPVSPDSGPVPGITVVVPGAETTVAPTTTTEVSSPPANPANPPNSEPFATTTVPKIPLTTLSTTTKPASPPPAPSQPQPGGNYSFTFDYLEGTSKVIRTSNNIDPGLVVTPQNIDRYTAQTYFDGDVVAIDCWEQGRVVNSVPPETEATSNYWFRLSGPIVSWATGTYGDTDMPLVPATHC